MKRTNRKLLAVDTEQTTVRSVEESQYYILVDVSTEQLWYRHIQKTIDITRSKKVFEILAIIKRKKGTHSMKDRRAERTKETHDIVAERKRGWKKENGRIEENGNLERGKTSVTLRN